MFTVIRSGITKVLPVVKATTIQKANVVSGPPKRIIPFYKKLALGGIMIAAVCAPGAWIMAHILDYRGARPTAE